MLTRNDPRLRTEVAEFRLRFACEDCAHFDAEASSCGEGYPCDEHRRARLEDAPHVVFCKAFELG